MAARVSYLEPAPDYPLAHSNPPVAAHCPLYRVTARPTGPSTNWCEDPSPPQPISIEPSGLCLGWSLDLSHPFLLRKPLPKESSSNPSGSGPPWGPPSPAAVPHARMSQPVHEAHCPPLQGVFWSARGAPLRASPVPSGRTRSHWSSRPRTWLAGTVSLALMTSTFPGVRAGRASGQGHSRLARLSPHHGPPQMSLALFRASVSLSV